MKHYKDSNQKMPFPRKVVTLAQAEAEIQFSVIPAKAEIQLARLWIPNQVGNDKLVESGIQSFLRYHRPPFARG